MPSNAETWSDDRSIRLPEPPPQYGTGPRCACGTKLSTYNPYYTCGPCRVRTTAALAMVMTEGGDEMPALRLAWEGRKRRALRRGPLFMETPRDDYDEHGGE